ncbi:MAG: hypothetical protein U9N60_08190 [Thermodesulfobacteriota bacterium]|nr:hypothetical protein [Thermodesulfobacteriota bacterium]
MQLLQNNKLLEIEDLPLDEEISKEDSNRFFAVVSTDLTKEQEKQITDVETVYPRQRSLLAVHWHPEFVPMGLIRKRIETTFPKRTSELIIPTQHNMLTEYDDYAGVEVDCYSQEFQRKVQLLLHFEKERVADAQVLKDILAHTFKYRSSQLFKFINAIVKPDEQIVNTAAGETGATAGIVRFVTHHVTKIENLLNRHYDEILPMSIKNKLLRNYFSALGSEVDKTVINRAQTFLQAVKNLVKRDFPLKFFYRTSEIIEEARSLGGGIVIPHPEQFWPVLLADYDVDGYEVWNPQSLEYTRFLIKTMVRQNRQQHFSRSLIVFMGDDTHMGEKTRPIAEQDEKKAAREIGVQPPWDDMDTRKLLIKAGMDRSQVISEYKARLAG